MAPVVVMVAGIGGAFGTMSMSADSVLTPKQGYYFVSTADRCHKGDVCSDTGMTICTQGNDGVTQLWKKVNETDITCPNLLFRP